MKKIILLFITAVVAVMFSSCGPHMYKTQSQGKDNVSYVVVLKESGNYENVSVVIDGQTYSYGKVYKVKAKRKAHPVITEPGKHNIKVVIDGNVVKEENIFLGLQETKTIVLR